MLLQWIDLKRRRALPLVRRRCLQHGRTTLQAAQQRANPALVPRQLQVTPVGVVSASQRTAQASTDTAATDAAAQQVAASFVPQDNPTDTETSADMSVAAGLDAVVAHQPIAAEAATSADETGQAFSNPAFGAAAAASDLAAAEVGMFGAQQRRQVVARLPGRRRGHAPLSEAQQRLQQQWQART